MRLGEQLLEQGIFLLYLLKPLQTGGKKSDAKSDVEGARKQPK